MIHDVIAPATHPISGAAAADIANLLGRLTENDEARDSGSRLAAQSPAFAAWLEALRARIAESKFVIVDGRHVAGSKEGFARLCLLLGAALGELVVQNAEGARLVEVFDRRIGRIEEGVRYHQTRQGGDIHTDSVNHPTPFLYLLLACTAPATVGGESIMVRAPDLLRELRAFPDVVEILAQDFWFEGRGMGEAVGFFRAPVLFEKDGETHFRYLRSYIEGAHIKRGEPLTPRQVEAFDVLDALLDCSKLQNRFHLECGEILVAADTQVFHGRTAFVDRGGAPGWAPHRHMFRLWVEAPA